MYPTSEQIEVIQAAYRRVCQERGHTVADVILNNGGMPEPIPGRREALSTTHWLAQQAAIDAANGNKVHAIYALTHEVPF